MMKILYKFSSFIYGNQSLISDEGVDILICPLKRKKMREIIDLYHNTGIWDFSSLNE